jgi:hypothetical protein
MSWTFIVHSIIAFVELATICQAFLKSLSYDPLLSNLSKPLPLADKLPYFAGISHTIGGQM